ncbi:MAG TPA: HD domain-containing protein [Blastocatellia bacterium]|nr:HD domain-containing protein [Blastocatellia bacterium]
MPTRDEAYALLTEYTTSESLIKHALAVETVMRAFARRYGEDEETWGIIGLLHDYDYERYPDPPDHPLKGAEILRARGYPEEIVRAILGHADYTGVPRDTLAAKVLYAVDELTGFIVACTLVRPSRSLDDLPVASVKKKLKDKAFARSVDRQIVYRGAEELGMSLDDLIAFIISALQPIGEKIGLNRLPPTEPTPAGEQQ